MYRHRPKDAHTFIGRTRVPVHISGIGFGLPCPEDLNFQPIYLLNDIGYINLKPAISSKQTVFIGNFPPIEPHVGPIANTIQTKPNMALQIFILQLEFRTIPPRNVKTSTIDCLRSEEHTSELQSRQYLVCRLLLEKK